MADKLTKPPGMSDEGWAMIDNMIGQLSADDQEALVDAAEEEEPQPTNMNDFLFGRSNASAEEPEEEEGS